MTTFYTGVTADLHKRVWQHREKVNPQCFTARNNCVRLVCYRFCDTIESAIREEKRIKGGSRKKKDALVNVMNPEWKDLWEDISNSSTSSLSAASLPDMYYVGLLRFLAVTRVVMYDGSFLGYSGSPSFFLWPLTQSGPQASFFTVGDLLFTILQKGVILFNGFPF